MTKIKIYTLYNKIFFIKPYTCLLLVENQCCTQSLLQGVDLEVLQVKGPARYFLNRGETFLFEQTFCFWTCLRL